MNRVFVEIEDTRNGDQLFQGEFVSDPINLEVGKSKTIDIKGINYEVMDRKIFIDERNIVFIIYLVR